LPVQNVASNRPIHQDELAVDRERGANLGGADALLDVFEQGSISSSSVRARSSRGDLLHRERNDRPEKSATANADSHLT
jgi:hypothetical protein